MKCQKCNESFKIIGADKERVGMCPKCGEKIIPMPNAFESISEAIYYCIQIGSKEPFDILNNKTKLNSYLEDTLGSSYPERNMIKAAIDSDIGATLFRAKGSSDGARKEAFDEAVDQMQRSYGTEIGIARKTVEYFTDAMGWSIIPEQPTKTKETVHTNVPPSYKTLASDNPPKTSQTPVINNMQSSQPQSTGQRQQHNNNYPAQQPQKPAKKKGCLKLFLVLTLFLLAAIAFIFLKVFLFSDSIEDESSKDNTSFSQNNEISENENIVTTYEAEEANEESSKTTKKTTTTEKNTTQTTTSAKVEETEKYTVRSLSQYIDYERNNHNRYFNYDSFDIDTENNVLYYALGDSIYTVDLDTGESESYTQLEKYNTFSGYEIYVLYNQYDHKMYGVLGYSGGDYLFDISTNEPSLIISKQYNSGSSHSISFTSEKTFCIVPNSSFYNPTTAYEINMTDQSEVQGYISRYWEYINTDIFGTNEITEYSLNILSPVFKNDSYYWLESNEGSTAICYTLKSICNDKENSGELIGVFNNTISQCVTDNEAYIMTDDFSIYRIDVEKLLDNYYDRNPESDYSFALELIIDGKDIKQTGVNNISEPMGLKMTKDGRFVVFDSFDNTFKIVEKK